MVLPEEIVFGDKVMVLMEDVVLDGAAELEVRVHRPDGSVATFSLSGEPESRRRGFLGCDPVPGVKNTCAHVDPPEEVVPAWISAFQLRDENVAQPGRHYVEVCGPVQIATRGYDVLRP